MEHKDLLIQLLLEKANNKTENITMKSDCIGKICMVRTYSAGVFYGEVIEKVGQEMKMKNARRVWYWAGAASLSTLATNGTSKPESCKFPIAVESLELNQVIEVIIMTDLAIKSLNTVKIWNN